jgi:hypothetical protein
LFVVALALVAFAWSWFFLGVYGDRGSSDTYLYRTYALQIRDGKVPYRDFAVEYPPGALLVFLGPSYVSGRSSLASYSRWFGRTMALLGVLGVVLVASLRRVGAVIFLALSPIAIGSLAETRFDIWPAVLMLGAIVALTGGKHRLGWSLLGAAFAAKFYALIVVPLAVLLTLRRRGRAELARATSCGALVICACYLPFVIFAPHGLWESIWRQASRPLEIESLSAAYLKTFAHPHTIASEGALAISGHGTAAAATTIAGAAVLLFLWAFFAAGPATDDRFVRYSAACVAAFIAFGKVLSPQYLIWLVPLIPLVRGRRGALAATLLLVALASTDFVWYDNNRFNEYAFGSSWAWLVLTRDLLLVAVVAALGFPARRELRTQTRFLVSRVRHRA